MIKKIESTQHPLIKEICSLHLAKYRAKTEKFIAEGNRTIRTLVAAGIAIDTLYYVSDAHLADLLVPDHQCVMVTEHVMKKISTSVTPSGTLAVFFKPKNRTLADITSEKTGLILLDIADPGNMGTLIRTAAAVNNHTIILIGGVDPWHPRVIQASAGTIGLVTIIETTWTDIKKELSNSLCALVVSGGIAPDQLVSEKKRFLVVGSEAHGIPAEYLADCTEFLTLPMPGGAESLNAAVAGSIALYLVHVHMKKDVV